MDGTRPVLVEVQALAAPSGYGTPQRVATGLDPRRLAVLLAVLERRAGASFASQDVFVQVSAGVRLTEPGADLAVAAALRSSLSNLPTPADALFLGEIGLAGEVRPVGGIERRLIEAGRLGFHRAFASARSGPVAAGLAHVALDHVDQLARALAA
jgi:DNA repair protein RadA/Sms